MEPTLKLIKAELKPIVKEENLKYKHINNAFQEILEYTDYFTINRRKHFLVLRFICQKQENTLSFHYRYVFNTKLKSVDEAFSFADKAQEALPGVTPTDFTKLPPIYQFVVSEGSVINQVPFEEQYKTVMEVFKNNYKNIIEHAKNIAKR